MTRAIHCRHCGELSMGIPLNSDDRFQGWKVRHQYLMVRKPERHGVTINGVFCPMDAVHCDNCNREIEEGSVAVARTMWNRDREDKPRDWETDFGTVVSAEQVNVDDTLSGERPKPPTF